ncbi:hypothetical protein RRG08_045523 [Elysia crispata]|uniref:Uncharacterized protein n=1 Tax=Elysia crispata TaxID=231223 RepID=A0AAE0YDJ5_9GAST|nr:hypothetical protein RRG08_045523 [Elysia crispata]
MTNCLFLVQVAPRTLRLIGPNLPVEFLVRLSISWETTKYIISYGLDAVSTSCSAGQCPGSLGQFMRYQLAPFSVASEQDACGSAVAPD